MVTGAIMLWMAKRNVHCMFNIRPRRLWQTESLWFEKALPLKCHKFWCVSRLRKSSAWGGVDFTRRWLNTCLIALVIFVYVMACRLFGARTTIKMIYTMQCMITMKWKWTMPRWKRWKYEETFDNKIQLGILTAWWVKIWQKIRFAMIRFFIIWSLWFLHITREYIAAFPCAKFCGYRRIGTLMILKRNFHRKENRL